VEFTTVSYATGESGRTAHFRSRRNRRTVVRCLCLLVLTALVCCCRLPKSELDETLEWMDNTYNPHENISGAYGHGRAAWYTHAGIGSQDEIMVWGLTETFTHRGCEMTLRTEDLPNSQTAQRMFSSATSSFNLRDIDPSTIKVRAFSHLGGFSCEPDANGTLSVMAVNCDHSEMSLKTRSAAGLIQEEWHSVFPNLTGADHERLDSGKKNSAYIEFDDPEYATRFAKAFAHAVELCGGKRMPF
jgi:hypothetical protein